MRDSVDGAGDQVDGPARQERLVQRAVNEVIRDGETGGTPAVVDGRIHYNEVRTRCDFDCRVDGEYQLRKWMTGFTLRLARETTHPAAHTSLTGDTDDGKYGRFAIHWCDAVPTNGQPNNPANFAELPHELCMA